MKILHEKKKKKVCSSVTYTTGDPQLNCNHFNKMLAGKEVNTHTDGILNGTFKNSAAEKACASVGTFASASPDGASSVSLGSGESAGGDAGGCCESLELNEKKMYVSKFGSNVEIPDHINIVNKNEVEELLEKLEPEEEFVVGYVTPIRFYSDLDDKFNLIKCTELTGYTGVDYIEARANDDANKEKRIEIAKNNIAAGKGVHLDRLPAIKKVGDFSANYVSTNKTVLQNNGNTLLFYPKVGSTPIVTYYLDLLNGNGFRKIRRDQLQRIILDRVQELATTLSFSHRWDEQKLADKIQKQLDSDAATISGVPLDKEGHLETRSRITGQAGDTVVMKPQVRALYTNQIYYIATSKGTLGNFLTEEVDLEESGGKKGRKVTRYYIRPQHIWCAKKTDILNALIDHADENCTVYTLINLDDNKDITKLTNKDIIYYYDDGILYDKNRVRVMDYDLAVKHEEDRARLDVEHASDSQIEKVYHDRITGDMNEELEFDEDECPDECEDVDMYELASEIFTHNVEESFSAEEIYDMIKNKDDFIWDKLAAHEHSEIFEDEDEMCEFCERHSDEIFEMLKEVFNNEAGRAFDEEEIEEKNLYFESLNKEIDEELNLDFEDVDISGKPLNEANDGVCCICGEPIEGYGNNPEPVKHEGRCCDACNIKFVIPARLENLK